MAEQTKYQLHLKGYVGGWDFDADYVDYILGRNSSAHVDVLIDSLGGQMSTGLSIAAAFRRHGDVHVHYSGMNASAATIAGMGATRISIDSNALFLVHCASFTVDYFRQANAEDFGKMIDELEAKKNDLQTCDKVLAAYYAGRCKKSEEDLLSLMKKDRWLSAQEALEWGFVDEVIPVNDAAPEVPKSVVMAMKESGLPDLPDASRSFRERITAAFSEALESLGLGAGHDDKDSITNIDNNMDKKNSQTPAAQNVTKPTDSAAQSQANEINLTPAASKPQSPANDGRQTPSSGNSSEIEDLKKKLEAAEARIALLEKKPGENTTNVVNAGTADSNDEEDDEISRFVSDMAEARELAKLFS